MKKSLSHIDEAGNASMVDVSNKQSSVRTAIASGKVHFPSDVFAQLSADDFLGKKGSIIQTAVIAGIQAVKKTVDTAKTSKSDIFFILFIIFVKIIN